VIVIDDASEDATRDIATACGANVFIHALDGDFAKQRNFALGKASGDWILFVDSDEVISPELAREIQDAIKKQYVGYRFARQDIFYGKPLLYGETNRTRFLRLAKRGIGMWVRPVHEVWDVNGDVGQLVHPIIHAPHVSVSTFLSDINRYTTLDAHYFFTNGRRVSGWQVIAYPCAKFFVNYILYQGWRDGVRGTIIALMMSMHSFLTRGKVWELQHHSVSY
jgi:glycosyltransferase involved in cell wall biosynthesis